MIKIATIEWFGWWGRSVFSENFAIFRFNGQFNISLYSFPAFHVDLKNNYTRRQYLASMLLPSDPDDGR